MQLLLLEFEVIREYIVNQVIVVDSINQPFSLFAMVHGSPAALLISRLVLHESPHLVVPHQYRILAR